MLLQVLVSASYLVVVVGAGLSTASLSVCLALFALALLVFHTLLVSVLLLGFLCTISPLGIRLRLGLVVVVCLSIFLFGPLALSPCFIRETPEFGLLPNWILLLLLLSLRRPTPSFVFRIRRRGEGCCGQLW